MYPFFFHLIFFLIMKLKIARQVAPDLVPGLDPLVGPSSPLLQLFKVAWAYKEVHDELTDNMLRWFEQHSTVSHPAPPIVI
jgi:hypothetical protein